MFWEFDYDMPWSWLFCIESNGSSLCSLTLMSVPFPGLGKLSAIICSHKPSAPCFLYSSSWTSRIWMSFLFNKLLSHLSLVSWSFAFVSYLFCCSVIFHNLTVCITELLLCFLHPCRHDSHSWLHLGIGVFILAWLAFSSFISAESVPLVSSVLFATPASSLIVVLLNSSSDILHVSVLITSSVPFLLVSFWVNSSILSCWREKSIT